VTTAPSLVAQRLELREQLRVQRQEVAEQLFASKAQGQFPRSMTMQLLIRRPELVGRLVALIGGARLAGSVSALFVVVQMLRASRSPPSAP
jgi:hypothetical protein